MKRKNLNRYDKFNIIFMTKFKKVYKNFKKNPKNI